MLILYLWGLSFHAVVVVGLGKDLLFKSVLGHCDSAFSYCFPFDFAKTSSKFVKIVFGHSSTTGLSLGLGIFRKQCPRTDLNKRSLPRPKTTTA